MRSALVAASFSALLCGCSADPAPVVEVLGASPSALTLGRDDANDLAIRVHYEDADGDLGGGVAEIHDCRARALVTTLPIPALATPEAVDEGVTIAGELSLRVGDVGAVSPGTSSVCQGLGAPVTAFCVILEDAAGNRSEGDCTGAIPITAAP